MTPETDATDIVSTVNATIAAVDLDPGRRATRIEAPMAQLLSGAARDDTRP
jgi:hypothetical protein